MWAKIFSMTIKTAAPKFRKKTHKTVAFCPCTCHLQQIVSSLAWNTLRLLYLLKTGNVLKQSFLLSVSLITTLH